jgi:hypothetical protein
MPKRTAKFVSAVFVATLAITPLATVARGETATAGACLSEPKAETAPGSHWYYRIDHANKRNCWYLRSEGGQSQAAAQNTSPAPIAAKPSVADARAEIRAQTSREDSPAVSPPTAVSPPANTPSAAWPDPPGGTATAAVATRWPDPAATSPVSNGGSGTANLSGTPPQDSADLPNAAAASAIADSPAPLHSGAIPGLIAAAAGALAFAGAATTLIARRRRVRLPRHRKMAHTRAPIWETTDDDRIVLSDHLPSGNRDYRPRFAQGARVQGDRRTEFISRMPRRAPR